jgi:hypothetical protein
LYILMSNKFLINQGKKKEKLMWLFLQKKKNIGRHYTFYESLFPFSSLYQFHRAPLFLLLCSLSYPTYIGLVILMIKNRQTVILFILVVILFVENVVSSKLLHIFPLRLKIKLLSMLSMPLLSWNGCAFFILT